MQTWRSERRGQLPRRRPCDQVPNDWLVPVVTFPALLYLQAQSLAGMSSSHPSMSISPQAAAAAAAAACKNTSRLLVVGRSLLHDGSLSGSWQVTRIMDL